MLTVLSCQVAIGTAVYLTVVVWKRGKCRESYTHGTEKRQKVVQRQRPDVALDVALRAKNRR